MKAIDTTLRFAFACIMVQVSSVYGGNGTNLTKTPDEYITIWNTAEKQNNFDLALTNYYKYLASDSNDVFALEGCGACFAVKKDMNEAIVYFSRAIQVAPTRPLDYINRANAYRYIGDFTNAIKDFNQCIRLNPTNDLAYKGLGAAYLSMGDYERAIVGFSEGLKLKPNDPTALSCRASAFRLAHEYTQALADYRQIMTDWPADADGYNGYAWFRATCSSADLRDGKQAVDAATKACNLSNWNDWRCVDTLAVAYAETGDFQKAVAFENEAILSQGISQSDLRAIQSRIYLFQRQQPYHE
jgi:tetratricopeptide (TPR) repeat protein